MKTTHLSLLTSAVVAAVSWATPVHAATMTFAQAVVADGAIAYWQLNDASTANGATAASTVNPGTYNGVYQSGNQLGNGVTSGAAPFAAMGSAAYFHNTILNPTLATSDAVIAPATGLPAGDSNRTLIFWEKDSVTAATTYYQIQADYGKPGPLNGGNFNGSFIPTIYPTATGQGFTNYGSTINTNTPVVNEGSWHFIAITADNSSQVAGSTLYSLYVDGALVTTNTNAQNTVLDQMTIGSATVVDIGSGTVVGWNGGLSNVALFDSVLSPGQIETLFTDAPNMVPEPSTMVSLLAGVGTGLVGLLRRRRRTA